LVFPFGSIVLTRFPFTDLSGDKRRSGLVVSRDNDRRPDLVVFFVTSDDFCAAGIAVEVTHRSKRSLFGLAGLTPLHDAVRPRGRPPQTGGAPPSTVV
jgi:hypothetical protein